MRNVFECHSWATFRRQRILKAIRVLLLETHDAADSAVKPESLSEFAVHRETPESHSDSSLRMISKKCSACVVVIARERFFPRFRMLP